MNFTKASLAQRTTDNRDDFWPSQVSEVRLSVANWLGESPERDLPLVPLCYPRKNQPRRAHVAILARSAAAGTPWGKIVEGVHEGLRYQPRT